MKRVDLINGLALAVALALSLCAARSGRISPSTAALSDKAIPVGGYRRIVSTLGWVDELVVELCPRTRIAAVSRWAPASWTGRLAGFKHSAGLDDLESLIALQPDVVVIGDGAAVADRVARLRRAGIAVIDVGKSRGLETLLPAMPTIAALGGDPARGQRLADSFAARMSVIAARSAGRPRPSAIYLTAIADRLFGGASGTSYHDVLTTAGLDDIAAPRFHGWIEYSTEQVIALDPEFIVTARGQADVLRRFPGFAALRACRDSNGIIELDPDVLEDAGMGMADAAQALSAAVFRSE